MSGSGDSNFVLTASADGTVRQWDVRSTECVMVCRCVPDAVLYCSSSVTLV